MAFRTTRWWIYTAWAKEPRDLHRNWRFAHINRGLSNIWPWQIKEVFKNGIVLCRLCEWFSVLMGINYILSVALFLSRPPHRHAMDGGWTTTSYFNIWRTRRTICFVCQSRYFMVQPHTNHDVEYMYLIWGDWNSAHETRPNIIILWRLQDNDDQWLWVSLLWPGSAQASLNYMWSRGTSAIWLTRSEPGSRIGERERGLRYNCLTILDSAGFCHHSRAGSSRGRIFADSL